MYAEMSQIVPFGELPDPRDSWELVNKIGEGTYGEVHKARHLHNGRIDLRGRFNPTPYPWQRHLLT
jgi:serine/threonine protein kinase